MLYLARQHPDLRDRDHLDRIYDGLRTEYKHYVRRGDFSSLDDLILITDDFEALKGEDRPQPAHTITLKMYERHKVCWRCKQIGHQRHWCTNEPILFCSYCGREGTFSFRCGCRSTRLEKPAVKANRRRCTNLKYVCRPKNHRHEEDRCSPRKYCSSGTHNSETSKPFPERKTELPRGSYNSPIILPRGRKSKRRNNRPEMCSPPRINEAQIKQHNPQNQRSSHYKPTIDAKILKNVCQAPRAPDKLKKKPVVTASTIRSKNVLPPTPSEAMFSRPDASRMPNLLHGITKRLAREVQKTIICNAVAKTTVTAKPDPNPYQAEAKAKSITKAKAKANTETELSSTPFRDIQQTNLQPRDILPYQKPCREEFSLF